MSNFRSSGRVGQLRIKCYKKKFEANYNAVIIRSAVIIVVLTLLDHSLLRNRNISTNNIFCLALQTSVHSLQSTKSHIVQKDSNFYIPVYNGVKSTNVKSGLFMVLHSGDWETRKKARRKNIQSNVEGKGCNDNTTAANRSGNSYYPVTTVSSKHSHGDLKKSKCHSDEFNHQFSSKRKQATKRLNQLLQKITKTRTVDATKEAESLILQMLEENHDMQNSQELIFEKYRESWDLSFASPDIVSFNIVLSAWAKIRTKGSSGGSSVSSYCAEQAQKLFEKMNSFPYIFPDTYSYGAIMNAIAKSGKRGAAKHVEQLLLKLEKERHGKANTILYNILLDALAREASLLKNEVYIHNKNNSLEKVATCANDDNAMADSNAIELMSARDLALKAEDVLGLMERFSLSSGNREKSVLYPNTISYNSCMKAWVNVGTTESAERVESLLQRMMSSNKIEILPNTRTISTVISCYAQIGNPQKAEDMLYQMESGDVWGADVSPDVVTYTTVISAWAKTGHLKGTQRALNLLQSMVQTSSSQMNKNTFITPNVITYNTVLSALANHPSGRKNDLCPAEKAEELLDQMKSGGITPDTITFSTVMDIYGHQGDKQAALRAEKLLDTMEEGWLKLSNYHARPNIITYSAVIRCWAQVMDDNDAPQRATEILNRLEQLFFKTKSNFDYAYSEALKPNKIIYNTVIECWSKSRRPDAVQAIDDLLGRMKRLEKEHQLDHTLPDATTYSFVINAWTKSFYGDNSLRKLSISRVEKLLEKIENSYNHGEEYMKPTPLLYSAVAQAYAKAACTEGATKAETLLRRNQKMYKKNPTKYSHMKPTGILFNAVIDAYARLGDIASAEKAQSFFHELIESASEDVKNQDLHPSTRTFNAAIFAWKNCGDPTLAHEKSEYLMKLMNEMYKNGDKHVKPDKCTINSYIGVLAKVGKAQNADDFLMYMEKMYIEKGDITYKPDIISFNTCIDAWANISVSGVDICDRINSLLNRLSVMMEYQDKLKPDLITLYSLLKAKGLLKFIKLYNPDKNVGLLDKLIPERGHERGKIGYNIQSDAVINNTSNEKVEFLLSALLAALKSEDNEMGSIFRNDQKLLKLFINVISDSLQQNRNHHPRVEKKLDEIHEIYCSLK